MIYDFITIWAWASWLFANINLPKNKKKIILEKNKIIWVKILMSWWERANLTNINIQPTEDYFSCNCKASIWFFKRFNNFDIINFFESNNVKVKIEDKWRVITKSWNAKDLLKVLIEKTNTNNTKIYTNKNVIDIKKEKEFFICKTEKSQFKTRNLIIATWGKSYPQVWTIGFWYKIAEKFWINTITPYKGLVWITTRENLSTFSGSSIVCNLKLLNNNKVIYEEYWPLLFTHFWISWPIVYNTVLAIWKEEKCNKLNINNLSIKIIFDLKYTTKKIAKYFNLDKDNIEYNIHIQNIRSRKEAKVSWWWIDTNELTKYLESKKHKWLFFIWEIVDITGKTWWFNLQWAWTSAYCFSEKFNTEINKK